MISVDGQVRQFSRNFRSCFSRPQFRYFEIVLAGLLLWDGAKTLTTLLRTLVTSASLAGLSRFFGVAPWSTSAVAATWRQHFDYQLQPDIATEQQRQRATQKVPGRPQRGRPPQPVVTGYLIGDDSTIAKPYAAKQAGLGWHHSTTAERRVWAHSLVQAVYHVLDRVCPLEPQLYRQQAVCERDDVPFQSKIALMATIIRTFQPLADTQTHVLLDSWYGAKQLWRAARDRDFRITTGLKSNRRIRVDDPSTPQGWRWSALPEYVATLGAADYQLLTWPGEDGSAREVYVHVVQTRVRTLYRCQVVIVRPTLDGPGSNARFWGASDLHADPATLLGHIATRWVIEQVFADTKELLGLDQYQVLGGQAIVRWWTVVMATYALLDAERARLRQRRQSHVTLGEARQAVQQRTWINAVFWLRDQIQDGPSIGVLARQLAA
jgi:hypothetical protein